MLISLLLASSAITAPTDPPPSECEQYVSKVLGAADAETRVVITFTGSQRALLPLDERIGPVTGIESTLFPVAKDLFILTVQVRPAGVPPSVAPAFAQKVCLLGVSNGARFNGVMSFKREFTTSDGRTLARDRMTDAQMAEPLKD